MRNWQKKGLGFLAWIILVIVSFVCTKAHGAALNPIGGHGARAKGMGGAQIAIVNDAASFPANIAGLAKSGSFSQAGFDLLGAEITYTDPYGNKYTSDEDYFIPLAGVAIATESGFTYGLGLNVPYVFGANFRNQLHSFSEISLMSISPAVAYDFGYFSLGAAVNLSRGDVELSQPLFFMGSPIGYSEGEADGWGQSFSLGLQWQAADWLRLGAVYQSPTRVELEGSLRSFTPTGSQEDDFDSVLWYPAKYGAGIGITIGNLLIAADVVRYDYSKVDRVDLDFHNSADDQLVLDWEDNTFYGLGLEYSLAEYWKLRTGLAYQEAVIPGKTMTPVTPDADGWCYNFGLGYKKGGFVCDLAYVKAIGEEYDVPLNYSGAGKYEADINIISASISWRW